MSAITDLERKIQSLKDQLHAAELAHYKARLESLGLVPNETVLIYQGKEYLFVSARMLDWAIPWTHGRPRKKNGDWAERDTCLYGDWKVRP